MTQARSEAARRLDAFVDAAFAFAVTLLIVGGGGAPSTLEQLAQAVGRAPSFAASFALIVMFWLGYRDVGRLWGRCDALSTVLSLAIVFLVLLYVFPLRLMVESAFHAMSDGYLPGRGLAESAQDFRFLFISYGGGFLILSGLYAALYAHHLRGPETTAEARTDGRRWLTNWLIMAGVAVLSLLLATLGPDRIVSWAPGVIYMLIPPAIGVSEVLLQRALNRLALQKAGENEPQAVASTGAGRG